ncbi:unnamed protein product [Peniophora sp. CBMAI 1063]|nr:unnamed protein product [Peniophora sp. CBMAI 1063]
MPFPSTPGERSGAPESWDGLARERVAAITGIELGQRVASSARQPSAHAQAELDRDIEEALRAVSTLRMARNSLSPIYRLPSDVLSVVFYFCTINNPALPNRTPTTGGWLAVTWVCSLWREVALHTPSLWVKIPLKAGQSVAEIFLERAKSAPLIVHVPAAGAFGPYPAFIQNVQLIASHIGHTEELSLHAPISLYNAVLEHLKVAAPVLKFGSLTSVGNNSVCLDLPADVFVRRAPMLRKLSLTYVMVPWTSIPWSSLRSLTILHRDGFEKPTLRGDFSDLCQGLSSAAHLEELVLRHCLPTMTRINTTTPTIPVNCIQSIELTGIPEDCLQLYELLDFPPSARVSICLSLRRKGAVDARKLASLLRNHFTAGTGRTSPVQTLDVASTNSYVKFRAWRSLTTNLDDTTLEESAHIHDPFSLAMHSEPTFSLELLDILPMAGSTERDILAELCQAIPLDGLRRLSFNSFRRGPAWGKAVWLNIFGRAKNVRSVRIHGDAAHSFSAALVTVPDDASAPRSKPRGAATNKFKHAPRHELFLPELRSLYLEDTWLDSDFSGQPFHVRLTTYLQQRSRRAPIDALYITDCTLQEEMLVELDAVDGLNVVWDGSRGEYEPDDEDYLDSDDYLSDFL